MNERKKSEIKESQAGDFIWMSSLSRAPYLPASPPRRSSASFTDYFSLLSSLAMKLKVWRKHDFSTVSPKNKNTFNPLTGYLIHLSNLKRKKNVSQPNHFDR